MPSIGYWKAARHLGLGRVGRIDSTSGLAQFTVLTTPGELPVKLEIPVNEVESRAYQEGQRVYVEIGGKLRAGRIREDPDLLITCGILEGHASGDPTTPYQIVTFSGGETFRAAETEIYPLSGTRIEDPTALLSAQLTEGLWWYSARRQLRDTAIRQRASYAGVTGLSSATIELEEHQFRVVRRILDDTLCRYILADEVGLGKTIEAGIVIRQHFIENPNDFALIIVPDHLKSQWSLELKSKFGMTPHLSDGRLLLAGLAEYANRPRLALDDISMLVIDEAHHLSRFAFSGSPAEAEAFTQLVKISAEADRVLLLSATPVLRSESGFLAMLNVLDPITYPLADIDGFKQRVENRQPIAELAALLAAPIPRVAHKTACQKLRRLAGCDEGLIKLSDEFEGAERADWPELQKRILRRIRRSHRLYDRLIRTRRSEPIVAQGLPTRSVEPLRYRNPLVPAIEEIIEKWRAGILSTDVPPKSFSQARSLYQQWVSLLLQSPSSVVSAIRERYSSVVSAAEDPLFPSESEVLSEVDDIVDNTLSELSRVLRTLVLNSTDSMLVVFLSSIEECQVVATKVGMQAVVCRPGEPAGFHRLLFVPREFEEGLNLQGARATLVFADLPLSQVRLEQRIGRVDRLGGRQARVTSIVLLPGGRYQEAWYDCVTYAGGVFTKSISNLQYLLNSAETVLGSELLEHGVEAFSRLRANLTSAEHELSVAREERRMLEQDLIDASAFEEGVTSREYQELEAHEYGGGGLALADALYTYVVEGLKFKALSTGGDAYRDGRMPLPEHPMQFMVSDRHLPRSMIVEFLGKAIHQSGKRWKTDWVCRARKPDARLTGSRMVLPLRIGNAFVDGALSLLDVDDRGRAFAVRTTASTPLAAGVYFCFEFIREILPPSRSPMFQRLSDRFCPPRSIRVWVDEQADRASPRDSDILDDIVEGQASYEIVSVKHPEEWGGVTKSIAFDWAQMCRHLRHVAENAVMRDGDWLNQIEASRGKLTDEIEQLSSDIDDRKAFANANSLIPLEVELEYLKDILAALDETRPRVDSVGVVFAGSHYE